MINKVEGSSSVRSASPVRKAGKAGGVGGASFSQHLQDDGISAASAVSGMSGVSGVSALIGIQEVEDATERAAKGKKRAQSILKDLDNIQVALITGALSKDQLLHLSASVQSERASVDDPRLASILDDIDLRARVELAKYGF